MDKEVPESGASAEEYVSGFSVNAQEQPVREQLKKASISKSSGVDNKMAASKPDSEIEGAEAADPIENGDEPRQSSAESPSRRMSSEGTDTEQNTVSTTKKYPRRKRSRDDSASGHDTTVAPRKISDGQDPLEDLVVESSRKSKAAGSTRESTPERISKEGGETEHEAVSSPKVKRTRHHSAGPEQKDDGAEGFGHSGSSNGTSNTSEPAINLATEVEKPKPQTSVVKPSSLSLSSDAPLPAESKNATTSSQAFAASGFSSLASAGTSGFGAIGKSSGGFGVGGSFASKSASASSKIPQEKGAKIQNTPAINSSFGGPSKAFASGASTSTSVFGASTSTSAFGALGQSGGPSITGFGKLGGGGLSNFASGKAVPSFACSATPVKPLGTPVGTDEDFSKKESEDGDGLSGVKSPIAEASEGQDGRFHERDLETGEEDEITEYSCRAKLYNFTTVAEGRKEWKERGIGVVRLNNKVAEGKQPTARLVMRADGSHRVVLNTPVKKELKFGDGVGGPPKGMCVYFMGTIEGGSQKGLELLQLKVSHELFRRRLPLACADISILFFRLEPSLRPSCTRRLQGFRRTCDAACRKVPHQSSAQQTAWIRRAALEVNLSCVEWVGDRRPWLDWVDLRVNILSSWQSNRHKLGSSLFALRWRLLLCRCYLGGGQRLASVIAPSYKIVSRPLRARSSTKCFIAHTVSNVRS